ncbi:uncharacterized protein K489DRAFT_177919 [Dissoconium aciculare CBS 342.82]|uniref:Uncharacterized protein n=1 Tax=Dissoconium aciculare CBS 342.82 TaxID=1314786 RepID=A0A6J3MBM9_9PEZI|nr:uncharacterized protein K489DRAFT_177919 [Dissoconium aciculare CBS 342.82]KAF1824242.1 hypothetical protein K489DRAFT_177919 [Dissoconium aciculare CBS 342.82]
MALLTRLQYIRCEEKKSAERGDCSLLQCTSRPGRRERGLNARRSWTSLRLALHARSHCVPRLFIPTSAAPHSCRLPVHPSLCSPCDFESHAESKQRRRGRCRAINMATTTPGRYGDAVGCYKCNKCCLFHALSESPEHPVHV